MAAPLDGDILAPSPSSPMNNKYPVEVKALLVCPQCKHGEVALLKYMRVYSQQEDWFRCDRCGHLFTKPRLDKRSQ